MGDVDKAVSLTRVLEVHGLAGEEQVLVLVPDPHQSVILARRGEQSSVGWKSQVEHLKQGRFNKDASFIFHLAIKKWEMACFEFPQTNFYKKKRR